MGQLRAWKHVVAGSTFLLKAAALYGMAGTLFAQGVPEAVPLSQARKAALDSISASSLRGHISFLASDLLEGRDTPSRGLDIAAEYIAAQFRRAGLEPAGTEGYFQTAHWKVVEPDSARYHLEFVVAGTKYPVALDRVRVLATGPLEISAAPLVRLESLEESTVKGIDKSMAEGRVFVVELPAAGNTEPGAQRKIMESVSKSVAALGEIKAAGLVVLDRREPVAGMGLPRGRLIDPESPSAQPPSLNNARRLPVLTVQDTTVIDRLSKPDSLEGASLSFTLGAPIERPVTLKNVAGILPGSDPVLKDEFIIVSGHYDHIGVALAPGGNDFIFNGANDDASGTTLVMELASALSQLEPHPKRSVLFLTFFGEEKGLLGSRYYGRHPLVPLKATAAMLNLEHMGRTDDSEGPSINRASMTGYDFSEVGAILHRAGATVGVEVFKHPKNSDAFFGRSDNQSLADSGIPAHTVCTSFLFPDYHRESDHWEQIDYANMARVGRAVGLGIMELADAPGRPRWDETNPKATRYVEAWKALHQAPGNPLNDLIKTGKP